MKELTHWISQLTRTPLGTLDKDATACFDRIVVTLVNLRGRQLGLSERQAKFLANFLLLASCALKTSLGVADERHTHCEDYPIYGTGQGARDSMAAWNLDSALLMELKSEREEGVYFCDPKIEDTIRRTIDGFVDDVTGWANRFLAHLDSHITDYYQVAQDLQNAGQWWEELLHASGGKLELPKCFFYMVVWLFDSEGRPRTATNEELNVEIQITQSEDGTTESIKQKECTVSHRTLGVHINPLGDMKTEHIKLKAKGHDFARKMSSAPVKRRVARTAYQSVYLSGMGWHLAATSFSRTELERIQSAPINALLPAMGCNRNMPREVVFGPQCMGGIGLRHLHIEQGSKQTLGCLRHLRHSGPVGKMIRIAMQWFQHLVGVSFSTFEHPGTTLSHAEGEWLMSVRTFLAASDCKLRVVGLQTVERRRIQDRALMDDAISAGLPREMTRGINRVRLFLQVECLSDICTPDGTKLEDTMWTANPSLPSRTHKLWPRQAPPGPKSLESWKLFLTIAHCSGDEGKLACPLGPWTALNERTWPHQHDPKTRRIAIQRQARRDKQWKYFTIQKCQRRCVEIIPGSYELGDFPKDSVPVKPLGDYRFTLPSEFDLPTADPARSLATTWTTFLATLPAWEQDLLTECTERLDSTDPLYIALQQRGTIYMVSDGGALGVHGSYGIVIGTDDDTLCEGKGTARGGPMQSFRAEGYGNLAGLSFLKRHIECYGIQVHPECRFVAVCDNEKLLQRLAELRKIPKDKRCASEFVRADVDVSLTIPQLELPFRYAAIHVKGHQDNHAPTNELSWEAQLNVYADRLATEALMAQLGDDQPATCLPLPGCNSFLIHHSQCTMSKYKQTLHNAIPEKDFKECMKGRFKWDQETLESVNWEAFRRATNKLKPEMRAFVTKLIVRWLPVGARMHRQREWTSNECHLCGLPETVEHLYQCPQRETWQAEFVKALDNLLCQECTDPCLRADIIQGTTEWLNEEEPTTDLAIGWDAFLRGYVVITHWKTQ